MNNSLTPHLIRYAYEQGAFPMADSFDVIEWYRPHVRTLFPIEGVHVSHSLKKTIRSSVYEVRFDTSFRQVMENCLRPDDNWINEEIISVYTEIFEQGWGHCAECWADEELVGGLYGIALGSCFCAESMFHKKTDASKVALAAMVDKCRELGFTMFDAQIMNSHLESMGAFEISHKKYMTQLLKALGDSTPWSSATNSASSKLGGGLATR